MFDVTRMTAALDRAALHPEAWPLALEACRSQLDAKFFGVIRVYQDDADLLGSPELTEAHLEAYRAGAWYHRDPRAAALTQLAPGRIVTDADLVSPTTRANEDFYRDFAAREDVPHMAGWRDGGADGQSLFVGVLFGAAHGPLRAEERSILKALQERMRSAFALSHAVTRAHDRGALDGLALIDTPAIGLDEDGRVTDATSAGEEILRDYFNCEPDGRLTARVPDAAAAISRLVAALPLRIVPDGALSSFHLSAKDGRRAIVTPLIVRGAARDFFQRTRVILVVRDMNRTRRPSTSILRALYGLTPTEIAVATHIAAGEAPAQIAAQRNVSTATIRTILRNVFRKAGVNRQSELAALLAQLGC